MVEDYLKFQVSEEKVAFILSVTNKGTTRLDVVRADDEFIKNTNIGLDNEEIFFLEYNGADENIPLFGTLQYMDVYGYKHDN